jgi:hypothetical protein
VQTCKRYPKIPTARAADCSRIFNNGQHKPIPFPCKVRANYDSDGLSEIFPDYSGKLSDKVEVPDAPKLLCGLSSTGIR